MHPQHHLIVRGFMTNCEVSGSDWHARLALEAADDGFWDWNIITGEAFFSPSYYRMLGYEPDEFEASFDSWAGLLHPDDREPTNTLVTEHVYEKATGFSTEFRMQTKQGDWRWILSRGRVVNRDDEGNPILLSGTHVDVTERKQSQDALLKSRYMLQTVLDTIPARVFWKDSDLKYLGCNQLFARDAGLNHPQEIVGKSDNDLPWGKHGNLHQLPDQVVIKTGESILNREEELEAADAEKNWISLNMIPLSGSDSEIGGVLGTYHDITLRKLAEKELAWHRDHLEEQVEERTAELEEAREMALQMVDDLAEARTMAEEANAAKSQFLANMSHELRTPLHGILSFADFGVNKFDRVKPDKLRGYFEQILESGRNLLLLLNDLLDLSKLESGGMAFEFSATDMRAQVELVVDEFASWLSERGLHVTYGKEITVESVTADPERIRQVIRNLLSNAVKFAPPGSAIEVTLDRRGDSVVTAIRNKGPQIPDEEMESVFDRFVQSRKVKSPVGGTGLGLSICREILDVHQGQIWAENVSNDGVEFLFSIPLLSSKEQPDSSPDRGATSGETKSDAA